MTATTVHPWEARKPEGYRWSTILGRCVFEERTQDGLLGAGVELLCQGPNGEFKTIKVTREELEQFGSFAEKDIEATLDIHSPYPINSQFPWVMSKPEGWEWYSRCGNKVFFGRREDGTVAPYVEVVCREPGARSFSGALEQTLGFKCIRIHPETLNQFGIRDVESLEATLVN